MVRHRGIGMNKPVKKKVEQPGLLSVKLLLQGHVRAAPPALEEAAVEAAVARPRPSPCKVFLNEMKSHVRVADAEAEVARLAAQQAERAYKKREYVRIYKIEALKHARKSNELSVLEKRHEKINNLIIERLEDTYKREAVQHIATVREKSFFELKALALEFELEREKRVQRRVKNA